MEKQVFCCKFCGEYFDIEKRMPRMIFKCGHSICSECLKHSFEKEHSHLVCPEDEKIIELKNKTIREFPPNFALKRIIEENLDKIDYERKNQKSSEKTLTEVESFENLDLGDLCEEHRKKLDIVCVTCKITICYQCALFENHKNHQVKQQNEFMQEFFVIKNNLTKLNEEISGLQKKISGFENQIPNLIQNSEKDFENKVENIFSTVFKKLENQKNEILKQKKIIFSDFQNKILQKIKNTPDLEKQINDWSEKTREICGKKNEDLSKLLELINSIKKSQVYQKGKFYENKLKDLENIFNTTINQLNTTELKENVNFDSKIFEILIPEIDLDSLLLNSDIKEEINEDINFDIRRYTENVNNNKNKENFKRKNKSLNMCISGPISDEDILTENENSQKDLSLNESFSFNRHSEIKINVKEEKKTKNDNLLNDLTISDIPELDINNVDQNTLELLKNDMKFNSVFNSIHPKSSQNNGKNFNFPTNIDFFKISTNKNFVMSAKHSELDFDLQLPLTGNFSKNVNKQNNQIEESSNRSRGKNRLRKENVSISSTLTKNKLNSKPDENQSARTISTKKKPEKSKSKSLSRTQSTSANKNQKNVSRSHSRTERYLTQILQGPKGNLIKQLENNKLVDLDLSFLNLNNNNIEALCPLFKNSKILKNLNLKGNQIGDKGIKALAVVLAKSNLSNLDISFNSITEKGIEILIELCKMNKKLKVNLKKNKINQKSRNNLITEFSIANLNITI